MTDFGMLFCVADSWENVPESRILHIYCEFCIIVAYLFVHFMRSVLLCNLSTAE